MSHCFIINCAFSKIKIQNIEKKNTEQNLATHDSSSFYLPELDNKLIKYGSRYSRMAQVKFVEDSL